MVIFLPEGKIISNQDTTSFHHLDWVRKKMEHVPIKLEKHIVSDPVTGYARPIRLLRSPTGQSDRLCLFLDGELYRDKMNVIPVLRAIQGRHALTFALIDHLNLTAREQDYTGNDQFGRFIGEKVVPWLEQEIPGLRPGHHLIGGLSLSGLASAWLALQFPGHFRYCLSQSGSFWWNQERFIKIASQRARINTRFWLSVGDQETEVDEPPPGSPLDVSQIEGVKNARRILKALGGTVHYHEYHGGHDMKYWRAELDQALHWLLAGTND